MALEARRRCAARFRRSRNGAARNCAARPFCCMPSKASATPSSSCATCRWWRRGAKVILEVPDSLMPLLGDIEGVTAMVSRGAAAAAVRPALPADEPAAGLRHHARDHPGAGALSARRPKRIAAWRARLPRNETPRVGLVWSGKPTHKNDHNRSIALARLAPLLAQPGIDFVSLQQRCPRRRSGGARKVPALCGGSTRPRRLRRHRGRDSNARSGDRGRYRGRASGRRPGQAGVDFAAFLPGLALDARPRRQPLVSERPAVPAAADRRLGQRDRRAC